MGFKLLKTLLMSVTLTLFLPVASADEGANAIAALLATQGTDRKADDCRSAVTSFNTAKAQAMSACRSSGGDLTSCSETLDSCVEESSEELSFAMPLSLDSGPSCSTYNRREYDQAMRDLEREKKDAQREIKDLQQRLSDIEKDYSDEKSRKTAEYQEAFVEKDEKDAEAKEEERAAVAEEQRTLQELERAHAQINIDLTQIQLKRSEILQRRAMEVDEYNLGIVKCKSDTRKFAKDMRQNTAGSLKSLQSGGGSRNADIKAFWEACVNAVLTKRNSEADRAKLLLQQNELEKAALMKQAQDISNQIALFKQTAEQAKNDRAMNAQKAEEAFMQRQQTRLNELVELDQRVSKQKMEMNSSLMQANMELNKKSNEVYSLARQKPSGRMSNNEILEKYSNFQTKAQDVVLLCENVEGMAGAVRQAREAAGAR